MIVFFGQVAELELKGKSISDQLMIGSSIESPLVLVPPWGFLLPRKQDVPLRGRISHDAPYALNGDTLRLIELSNKSAIQLWGSRIAAWNPYFAHYTGS